MSETKCLTQSSRYSLLILCADFSLCTIYNLYPGILHFKFGELLKTNRSVYWTLLEISPKLEVSRCFLSHNLLLHAVEKFFVTVFCREFSSETEAHSLGIQLPGLEIYKQISFLGTLTFNVCQFFIAWTRHNSVMISVVQMYSCREDLLKVYRRILYRRSV